jgi:hypothetical protein
MEMSLPKSQLTNSHIYKYFAPNGAMKDTDSRKDGWLISQEIRIRRGVEVDRRTSQFVSLQNSQWRCIDVNRD